MASEAIDDPDVAPILDGLKVLDLSRHQPGSVATLLLAECGADVIKVEPPAGNANRQSPAFATWNRSKRSLATDLHSAPGRDLLEELLSSADVIVHDLDSDEERGLGLEPQSLRRRWPRLVICRIGNYPVGHPDAERPGSELLVLARLGILDEQRVRRPGPAFLAFPLASWGATHLAAIGIMARLFRRLETGRGGVVSTSLAQGALIPMTMHWFRAERPSVGLSRAMPKDRAVTLFECGDGAWIHVMKSPDDTPKMRAGLEAMGPTAIDEANRSMPCHPYCPNQGANTVIFRQRSSAEWLEHLWAHDIPAQRAMPPGSAFHDEQARINGYEVEIDDPQLGPVLQAGSPLHVSPPARVLNPAPTLGQHNAEIVDELKSGRRTAGSPLPARPSGSEGPAHPLSGVRVVDLGSHVAGPFGPMLLADLGADVVKVEAPTGDLLRWNEAGFEGCQRGKRGVVVDLRDPEQRPMLESLVRWADVVHHNMRMPAATRLGVDGDSLRHINEAVVFCHVSSYGPAGSWADWPGFDQLFQALSGWEVESAGEGNPPLWLRFGMMDHQAAMASVLATLLALYRRRREGVGQDVAASLLGAALLTTSHSYGYPDGGVAPVPQVNHEQTGFHPACRLYECRDGWIAVASDEERVDLLCAAVDAEKPDQLEGRFAELFQRDALGALERAHVPAEAVRTDQRLPFFDSEENRSCLLSVANDHATYGRMEQIGAFWDFDDLSLSLGRAAPALGQHTTEILDLLDLQKGLP